MIFVFRENSISKYGTTSLHPKAPAARKVYSRENNNVIKPQRGLQNLAQGFHLDLTIDISMPLLDCVGKTRFLA